MAAAGFAAAASQTLFLREYLTIFSGNELVIGVILGLWLLFVALGSSAGGRLETGGLGLFSLLYIFSVLLGFSLLRASRLLFPAGAVIQPWAVLLIVTVTLADAAVFSGLVFGRLSRDGSGGGLYRAESAGAAAGLAAVTLCIFGRVSNGIALSGVMAVFAALALVKNARFLSRFPAGAAVFAAAFLLLAFCALDPVSVRWKYGPNIDKIESGYEGEIAWAGPAAERTVFLNNTLYRSAMTLPAVEQAVHVPAAMHAGPLRRALVAGNAGQVTELGRYRGLSVECLETEPLLAGGSCRSGSVEALRPSAPFDLVLLGSSLPSSVQSSRLYTLSFFRNMRRLTGDSGVFSFTLPLSENYLSPREELLRELLQATLAAAFRHVFIVPGEGYTFIASDAPLPWPVRPAVQTSYLEPYTLAALTPERVALANRRGGSSTINTSGRPAALLLAQQEWLTLFNVPFLAFAAGIAVALCIGLALSPRSRAALSVGTSGFTAGVYSIALLLLYQNSHGTLYSGIAPLLVALAVGFALGSRLRRFPLSDLWIGVYAAGTLVMLTTLSGPPIALYLLLHAGMGFLAGGQFVTRQGTPWGGLYAADCAGGVLGMALCSTVLVPWFGVPVVAGGLFMLKIAASAVHAVRDAQDGRRARTDSHLARFGPKP